MYHSDACGNPIIKMFWSLIIYPQTAQCICTHPYTQTHTLFCHQQHLRLYDHLVFMLHLKTTLVLLYTIIVSNPHFSSHPPFFSMSSLICLSNSRCFCSNSNTLAGRGSILNNLYLYYLNSTAAEERNDYMVSVCRDVCNVHTINRKSIYDDVFENEEILKECPLKISFTKEMVVDTGGISYIGYYAPWRKRKGSRVTSYFNIHR